MTYSRELLIGQWYRTDSDKQGNLLTEYATISADGSYEFSFIEHDSDGKVTEQIIELGDWGLVGDIHFTIAKSEFINEQHMAADLANPDNYHAYNVLRLDHKIFEYQHVISQEIFLLTRVTDNMAFC